MGLDLWERFVDKNKMYSTAKPFWNSNKVKHHRRGVYRHAIWPSTYSRPQREEQQVQARHVLPDCRVAKLRKTWPKPAIEMQDLLVMRYKMSSNVSSFFPCSQVCPPYSHVPSFIYPSVIQNSLPLFSLLSLSPTHFTQNTFLSFIFFPSRFLFLPPLFFLPPSLCLLDISLSPFCIPPPSTPPPPTFPCDEWVCLLGAVHIYWAGERTLSVSLTLHISIHSLKRQREQEVTVGWEEAGGRGQEIYSRSHCYSSWLGREHISPDQHSFSMLPLEVV